MSKIVLKTITSGYNSTALLTNNFDKITAAFENTLSRDGSTPNAMLAPLDMNSNRIINLGSPLNDFDAINKNYLEVNYGGPVNTDNFSQALVIASGTITSRSIADHLSAEYNVLDFGATGDGITDDTAAIQLCFDSVPEGATVLVPGGKTFKCTSMITVDQKIDVRGGGLLNFTAGITNTAAIQVNADGCRFSYMYLKNPNELQSQNDGRNYGFEVKANNCSFIGNLVELFQNGIAVRSDGEYYNHIIVGNRIKDCIGAGPGVPDDGSSEGEDRGDGIVTWGAQCTVVGNIVNAKVGEDCRIGIHGEGLNSFRVTDAPHNEALCTFGNNVVYGQFRRSLVFEGIRNAVISGNSCADATFWGMTITQSCDGSSIVGNTIKMTRTAADTHGASWSPERSGIFIYGSIRNSIVSDNNIMIADGSSITAGINVYGVGLGTISAITQANPGVVSTSDINPYLYDDLEVYIEGVAGMTELNNKTWVVKNADDVANTFELANVDGTALDTSAFGAYSSGGTIYGFSPTNTIISNNLVRIQGNGVCTYGIKLSQDVRSVVQGNMLRGKFSRCIYSYDSMEPIVTNNTLDGIAITSGARGMHFEAGQSSGKIVTNNKVKNFETAIYAVNGVNDQITGNYLEQATTGINAFGATYASLQNNVFVNCTTRMSSYFDVTNIIKNNSYQIIRATQAWNVGSLVDGAREQYGSDITVTGAALGDIVKVTASINTQGIKLVGWVKSTDTINIAVENETGSTIDLANATYYIEVEKRI